MFADVIYVMAAVASGGRGLAVITLKYCSGLDLYIPSSFQPGSAVVILQHSAGFMKNTNASLSTVLQESIMHPSSAADRTSLHAHPINFSCMLDRWMCVCERHVHARVARAFILLQGYIIIMVLVLFCEHSV